MKKTTGQLLQEFIAKNEKNVESFAKAIGVGTASVYRWFGEYGPRSKAVRMAVEVQTGGKIKASAWPESRSRWTGHKKAVKKVAGKKRGKKAVGKKAAGKKAAKKTVKKTAKKNGKKAVKKTAKNIRDRMPGAMTPASL